jgi:hypothetical protein
LQRRRDRRSRCSTQFGLARLALERPLKSRTPSATTSELFSAYRESTLTNVISLKDPLIKMLASDKQKQSPAGIKKQKGKSR